MVPSQALPTERQSGWTSDCCFSPVWPRAFFKSSHATGTWCAREQKTAAQSVVVTKTHFSPGSCSWPGINKPSLLFGLDHFYKARGEGVLGGRAWLAAGHRSSAHRTGSEWLLKMCVHPRDFHLLNWNHWLTFNLLRLQTETLWI